MCLDFSKKFKHRIRLRMRPGYLWGKRHCLWLTNVRTVVHILRIQSQLLNLWFNFNLQMFPGEWYVCMFLCIYVSLKNRKCIGRTVWWFASLFSFHISQVCVAIYKTSSSFTTFFSKLCGSIHLRISFDIEPRTFRRIWRFFSGILKKNYSR